MSPRNRRLPALPLLAIIKAGGKRGDQVVAHPEEHPRDAWAKQAKASVSREDSVIVVTKPSGLLPVGPYPQSVMQLMVAGNELLWGP
jgi:hypothetical protein